MSRVLSSLAASAVVVFALVLAAFSPAQAQNYPFALPDMAQEMSMPEERFERWWSQAPEYMRTELKAQPLGKWRPTVLCDYLGFRVGTAEGVDCREKKYKARMASADQWSPDGTYLGPSAECVARNKTDKWGRLVCE